MSECSLSGRGQCHVSDFYILHFGLRKFRHSKSSLYWWYTQLDRRRFVYDTYKTMKATQARHGWVHMFITHRSTLILQPWRSDGRRTLSPTTTLQLHNFDLFRTCRTSSFSTVAWKLARFQLTQRIARSLGDSWASCQNGSCLPSWIFEVQFLTVWVVKRPSLHHGTKFRKDGQTVAEISRFLWFSKWRPSAILDLLGAYWDHPWWPLGGLYRYAKFG